MVGNTLILEINLISAQGLKLPSADSRRSNHAYAMVWVDSTTKLRTRTDRLGGENPSWNDRFLFRVPPNFIVSDTSAVTVEIYAAGYIRDVLMGSVRLLLSNCFGKSLIDILGIPTFTAVQVRRTSGKFHGVLNVAATVYGNEDFPLFNGLSAISFRDLMRGQSTVKDNKESLRWKRRLSRVGSKRSDQSSGGESCDFDLSSMDLSDGSESTTSSSSSTATVTTAAAPNALKEWNGLKKGMAGKLKVLKSADGPGGLMCGLMLQRRACLCPSDRFWEDDDESFQENL